MAAGAAAVTAPWERKALSCSPTPQQIDSGKADLARIRHGRNQKCAGEQATAARHGGPKPAPRVQSYNTKCSLGPGIYPESGWRSLNQRKTSDPFVDPQPAN